MVRVRIWVAAVVAVLTVAHDLAYALLGLTGSHAHLHGYRSVAEAVPTLLGLAAIAYLNTRRLSVRGWTTVFGVSLGILGAVEVAERAAIGVAPDAQLLLVVLAAGLVLLTLLLGIRFVDWAATAPSSLAISDAVRRAVPNRELAPSQRGLLVRSSRGPPLVNLT